MFYFKCYITVIAYNLYWVHSEIMLKDHFAQTCNNPELRKSDLYVTAHLR